MPSEAHSPRKWTRTVSTPASLVAGLLLVLALLVYLSLLPYAPQHHGPRFVGNELLRSIALHGQAVSRWDLSRKVQDYRDLFMLQPDGYLAAALTGRPFKCVGPVEAREDGAGAGAFEMGAFYARDGRDNWLRVDSPTSAPSP